VKDRKEMVREMTADEELQFTYKTANTTSTTAWKSEPYRETSVKITVKNTVKAD
jgi:hypothetical protein